LCGTYTIGGSNPSFDTFNDAVSSLANAGISCPVTFKVRNGTYSEQVEVNQIEGSSATNTVTFESESKDSSLVILSGAMTLNNTSNIIINKLGTNAGGKLEEIGSTHWASPNSDATNERKFAALPSGFLQGFGAGFFSFETVLISGQIVPIMLRMPAE
jgi:pectin methylesterase-like acyl-CoA thioesterase